MNILFLGRKDSIFVKELIENLISKYNLRIELIDIFHYEHLIFTKGKTQSNSFYPKTFLQNPYIKYLLSIPCGYIYIKKLSKTYDRTHMFYKKFQYYFLVNLLKNKSKKIYLSIFGSDFYKNPFKLFDNSFYKKIDLITFASQETQENFNNFYNQKFTPKTIICPFGQNNLDFIDKIRKIESENQSKKILNIPQNKIIICCGSNGSVNEQHEQIINQLSKIKNKSKIILIFPLTYGATPSRINKIKNLIRAKLSNLQTQIIDKYLSSEDIARLRICTNVLINIRKTDQISGAMLESLYTNSIVVTGSWLPYKILHKDKVNYIKIPNISKLNEKLTYCLNNIDKIKKQNTTNPKKIYQMYSWKNNLTNWKKLY